MRRKQAERSLNLSVLPDVVTAANGGQVIVLRIPRSLAVASTTDGRYFLRVADQSKPVTGDDVMRLASERAALPWETLTTLQLPRTDADRRQQQALLLALRASDRVKASVKEKIDDELPEAQDRVQVTVRLPIHAPEIIDFIAKADQTDQLTQRERIALGLLAQHDALTARELAVLLELPTVEALQLWPNRLLGWQLLQSGGRTQATRYFVAPGLLRALNFNAATTLKRIEPHRLADLIPEDEGRYTRTKMGDRRGCEIPRATTCLDLVQNLPYRPGVSQWRALKTPSGAAKPLSGLNVFFGSGLQNAPIWRPACANSQGAAAASHSVC